MLTTNENPKKDDPNKRSGYSPKKDSNLNRSTVSTDSRQGKLLDIELPVKKRSIAYFKVIDQVKKHVVWGSDSLKNNKNGSVANAISQLDLALYYLDNIKDN